MPCTSNAAAMPMRRIASGLNDVASMKSNLRARSADTKLFTPDDGALDLDPRGLAPRLRLGERGQVEDFHAHVDRLRLRIQAQLVDCPRAHEEWPQLGQLVGTEHVRKTLVHLRAGRREVHRARGSVAHRENERHARLRRHGGREEVEVGRCAAVIAVDPQGPLDRARKEELDANMRRKERSDRKVHAGRGDDDFAPNPHQASATSAATRPARSWRAVTVTTLPSGASTIHSYCPRSAVTE